MLSDAIKNGALVRVKCAGCSPVRWYHPEDLRRLYGNVPTDNLERLMPCGKCGHPLDVDVTMTTAEERQRIRVRRLNRIWWVRRASWREE